MEINVQCQRILEGIEQLEKYLQEKIAKEALDLDSNYETTSNQELLSRLKKSLLQYTDRGKNLIYVGFMGHFSAGKSSTINSLLELQGNSEEARRVGLNPVDKSITLITHSENKDSIFKTTKEGLISIRASFIDSDLLKNVVIADTPGIGDPILASEIARDFLPICDLIVYFFSAAIPLDSSDVPLLQEKYSQLAFIPMRFVVTRADEFKKNHGLPFSKENFNEEQANIFSNELIQRINLLFKNDFYIDESHITLIDNKSGFNMDYLRNVILGFSNSSDIQSQINIHSHKIVYFRDSAEKLKEFFRCFLFSKLEILSRIIKTSENNIEHFQGKIRLTNNALTESWNKVMSSIYRIENEIYGRIALAPEIPEPIDLIFRNSNSNFLNFKLRNEAERRANLIVSDIRQDVILSVRNDVLDKRRKINSLLSLRNFSDFEPLKLNFSDLQKDRMSSRIELLPTTDFSSEALKIRGDADKNLEQYQYELRVTLEELKLLLTEQQPVKEYKLLLDQAIKNLNNDFDVYFESIKVYRSGVFSLNVKEAISKLGLGRRMDELEADELTNEQKEIIKQDAQKHVFPGASQVFLNPLKDIASLQTRIEELQRKNNLLFMKRGIVLDDLLETWKNTEVDNIKSQIINEVETAINSFEQEVNNKLQQVLTKFVDEWEVEVSKLRSERRKRFLKFTVSSGLIGLFLYFAYVFGAQRETANNFFVTLLVGLAINLFSDCIGFVLAKTTDKFPRNLKAKESTILGKLRDEYSKTIDENITKLQNSIDVDGEDLYTFWNKLLVTDLQKVWFEKRKAFINDLKANIEVYSELKREYLQIVDTATESASSYFSDPNSNLEKLVEFSDGLQKDLIKPSFDLLAETEKNLNTVIQNIQEVNFV
ncbi:hypothetical protein [Egbenema bharatensis]|uniref:hypothetical protein n=1 Tax=Egbenema bharatensis TaxID=3463334 RepID=UPI003A8424E5